MTQFDVTALSGATVRSSSGDKIGTVSQVYVDDRGGRTTPAQPATGGTRGSARWATTPPGRTPTAR
jgi:hypothetical protein